MKNPLLRLCSLLFAIALVIFAASLFTGCASETASITTSAGSTRATLDANPGIVKGQAASSTALTAGAVVNAVDGLSLVFSLPATATGTETCTFKNTPAMQLADDAAGLKAFGQNAAATFKEYEPQFVALANNVAGFSALAYQIANAAGWAPADSSQAQVFTEIETDARLAATSTQALDAFLTNVQQTGTVSTAASGSSGQ